jgi:hypothetical protein
MKYQKRKQMRQGSRRKMKTGKYVQNKFSVKNSSKSYKIQLNKLKSSSRKKKR